MKKRLNNSIYFYEYVTINGISQYLLHSGTTTENPVLLFLHGGPGDCESLFAHSMGDKWENLFTVVHWDQRGAGKTLTKNPNRNTYPTMNILLNDLYEIINYLKLKYNKDKIILLGHSFGTILGTEFIRQFPKDIEYYIGVGQVIDIMENEKVGYTKLKETLIRNNCKRDLKTLEDIGDYPEGNFQYEMLKKIRTVRYLQQKHKLAGGSYWLLIKMVFKSPIFKFSDILSLVNSLKVNQQVLNDIATYTLNNTSTSYKVPIFYILGEEDWQTPYTIAQTYFKKIHCPCKKLYLIPKAGHLTMIDQKVLFEEALFDITKTYEKSLEVNKL